MLSLLSFLVQAPTLPPPQPCWQADWCEPAEPFRVVGNVHYVGTRGLSAYLITGPRGHVLIDGGLPQSAALIAANVRKLGFRMRDVRYLLNNHAHFDHSGGLAELKRRSGARLVASREDAPDLIAGRALERPEQPATPPVAVDRMIGDGGRVILPAIRLTAILTPGHTPGATSWLLDTRDGDRPVRVLFASSLTVAGLKLPSHPGYGNVAADFRATFGKLRRLRADVFLSFHGSQFGLEDKRARLRPGAANPFIDPSELGRQVAAAERAFEQELAAQGQ